MKKESENILWFSDLSKNSIPEVGGKGANLGEMFNIKLPIPNGFCVTAEAYRTFLDKTGIKDDISTLLKNLNIEDTDQLDDISYKIRELIVKSNIPKKIEQDIIENYGNLDVDSSLLKSGGALDLIKSGRGNAFVAVRSSATAEDLPEASFAGQQATFLNVKGNKALLESIKNCWASLFNSRAIYYRETNNFEHMKVYISVVVHKMVNGDVSGVMFTANPTNNDSSEIMIEGSYGVGETIVSGQVNPDNFVVDKESLEIKDKKIKHKDLMIVYDENLNKNVKRKVPEEQAGVSCLTDSRVKELAEYGKKIEEHYGKPMDIEWGVERNKLYILQARPITTLKKKVESHEEIKGEIILEGLNASPGVGSGKVKIVRNASEIHKVMNGDVLVAEMTNPDYVVAMKKARAIVTDEGGSTSHAAIVSRELGIPAVVGTEKATSILKDGDEITVDGSNGKVYKGIIEIKEEKEIEWDGKKLETKTKIYMNLGEPEIIDKYKDLPIDGIGLMRIEFLITSYVGKHPLFLIKEGKQQEYVDKLVEGVSKVAKAISPRPMIVRFSDFKTNEYGNLEGGKEYEHEEENPMIGFRGVSRYVSEDFVEAFKLELKAVLKIREDNENVHVMLPFVRNCEEVKKALEIMRSNGLTRSDNFKIYLMAEVPAIAIIPEDFAELEIDGVSIGSNDLTQLVLGVDRDNEKLGRMGYFDERNKAVLKAIKNIVKTFKEKGKYVGICGQAPSNYPEVVKFLVDNNIDSISVNPDVVVKTMKKVYDIENQIHSN